jgi:hypothetical protein
LIHKVLFRMEIEIIILEGRNRRFLC